MANPLFNRIATPLTAGLFLVSAVSGAVLFFHTAMGTFHEMHEWLSMLLLVPFGLHVWKNWRPLLNYLRRGWLSLPLAVSLAAALAFAAPGLMGTNQGNPNIQAVGLMTQARLSDLAPVLKKSPDGLIADLRSSGYAVASADVSLNDVAVLSGKEARGLLISLVRGSRRPQ